jgi:hypothetical protein
METKDALNRLRDDVGVLTTMREPGIPVHGPIFVVCETEFTLLTTATGINEKNCLQNQVFLQACSAASRRRCSYRKAVSERFQDIP